MSLAVTFVNLSFSTICAQEWLQKPPDSLVSDEAKSAKRLGMNYTTGAKQCVSMTSQAPCILHQPFSKMKRSICYLPLAPYQAAHILRRSWEVNGHGQHNMEMSFLKHYQNLRFRLSGPYQRSLGEQNEVLWRWTNPTRQGMLRNRIWHW